MNFISTFKDKIFSSKITDFEELALELFQYQAVHNQVYASFIQYLCLNPRDINCIDDIPFLPIRFFKTHEIRSINTSPKVVFESSGTTKAEKSKHIISDISFYHQNAISIFEHFYGALADYKIFALLPSYLDRKNASLVHMINAFCQYSGNKPDETFYNRNYEGLLKAIGREHKHAKMLLIGVSFALLELAEKYHPHLPENCIVMETGGMKGQGRELPRIELHQILTEQLGVKSIHSEYGMTELLSQAYSSGAGKYFSPRQMRVLIRDIRDPFSYVKTGEQGAINIIDLANVESCAFIETQDLGKRNADGSFEVLGRMDEAMIRGCNLIFSE